jgi:UDP-glucuronate decarboxylase
MNFDKFKLIEGDIREDLELPPVDEIYHLASRASPADFTEFPVKIALTNTTGTRNILDHAVEHEAKVIYASSSEVYGDPEVHPQPESYNGNVNIRGPRGCYDESKRFGETLTVAYHQQYNIDVQTVRIFNTYGPRMREDDGRVIPTFVSQALSGDDITVYGDGTQTRSFCFVSDTIAGIRALANGKDFSGGVFNIGNSNEISIKRLAKLIVEMCDSESQIVHSPLPEDDPQRRCPDLTKTRSALNWEPNISLKEGLSQTISYFEEQ